MNTATQLQILLSLATVTATVAVVARPRRGRFVLARVPDADRTRGATRRIQLVNLVAAAMATVTILLAPDPSGRTQLAACFGAVVLPLLWIARELRRVLSGADLPPVSSRFRVSLQAPPSAKAYLSVPLHLLNLAAMVVPPVLLSAVWGRDPAPLWSFFLPLMLFLTGVVLTMTWMQARERWVLPAREENETRYVELQHARRLELVRLLETALVLWNVAAALIWVAVGAHPAGPGEVGGILAVALAGPGVIVTLAARLPRLTRIADELAALAGTDALGTHPGGWRWGGLVYVAPADPAVFVPRRGGLGQTLNLARPAAWCFLLGAVVVPPAIALLAFMGVQS